MDNVKAVILAGGLGKRLRPVVGDIPKSMAVVCGKPFLLYQIDYLRAQGIKNIVLCVSYLKEHIIDYFGCGEKFGVNIEYAIEQEPLGTAGAVKNAARTIDLGSSFLLLNGDTFIDLDLFQMNFKFNNSKADMVMAVSSALSQESSLIKIGQADKVIEYMEKPQGIDGDRYFGAGVYMISKNIVDSWPEGKLSIEYDCIPELILKQKVYAQVLNSKIYDIGTPEKLNDFIEFVRMNSISFAGKGN